MKRSLGLVVGAALLGACGGHAKSDESAPSASPGADTTVDAPAPNDDSPTAATPTPDLPTSGEGEVPGSCVTDADCLSPALDTYLTAQAQPVPAPRPFASSKCVGVSQLPALPGPLVEGPACHCMDEFGNPNVFGPAGLGCVIAGRTGECLLDEFPGCDVTDPSTCDAVCADVHQRLADDAARSIDVELLGAMCVESTCFHPVRMNDLCSVNGRVLDCSLSPAAMVSTFLHPPDPPVPDAVPFSYGGPFEIEGVSGTVRLVHRRRFSGTTPVEDSFSVSTRFYSRPTELDTLAGEIIDPLEGRDDCGVFRSYGYFLDTAPTGPLPDDAPPFLRGQRHALIDGDTRYALPDDLGLDLGALGAQPRFGGSYAFEALGGTAGMLRIEGPVLPDALTITTLERQSRLPQAALSLAWTGQRGTDPLVIRLGIFPRLGGTTEQYTILCNADDDGEFTIPEAVLGAVPPGFVTGDFFRDDRRLLSSGPFTLLAIGSEWVTHQFALGDGCQRPDGVEACQSFAQALSACGKQVAPADICPDYLGESCEACPEYYECRRQTLSCDGSGAADANACYCP